MALFIVFEGGDGSGKTTQARALFRRLQSQGSPVLLTHEPGGTPLGESIRRRLKARRDVSPLSELFLFAATPLPFDVVGILAGTVRFPVWWFLLWVGAGKILNTIAIAMAARSTIAWLERIEMLPYEVTVQQFQPLANGYQVRGEVKNLMEDQLTIPGLIMEFVDAEGKVIESETFGGDRLDPEETASFQFDLAGDGVAAWRYRLNRD